MNLITKVSLIVFITCSIAYSQKIATLGDSTFYIKGEKIVSYNELGLYASTPNWIEIYLYLTKDSIIVTELQKPLQSDDKYKIICTTYANLSACNTNDIYTEKYDLIKEPENYLKVIVPCIYAKMDFYNGTPHGWDLLHNSALDGLRIIVPDINKANDITNKIKAIK